MTPPPPPMHQEPRPDRRYEDQAGAGERIPPFPDLGAELVRALRGMPEAIKESLGGSRPTDDAATAHDKLNAIVGFEFKQNLPVIKDTDFDVDRHVR